MWEALRSCGIVALRSYLDVFHRALQRVHRLRDELQPVASRGVEGPHPGGLSVGRGRGPLLLLRLVGEVILILQHLHFQHLTHHVSACAAQQREGGGRQDHGGGVEGRGVKKLYFGTETKMASP